MPFLRSVAEILDEIRRLKGLESDMALGEIFGVRQSTVASWRSRNSLPYEDIIAFCIKEGISTDKIFFKQGPVKIIALCQEDPYGHSYSRSYERSYELDDLFATRLTKELKDRTVEWLAAESNIDKLRIEEFIFNNTIPTVDELEAIADAIKVSPGWLAEKSTSPSENWLYEFYRKDDGGFPYAEIYKLYLVAAEEIIEQMQGLIVLSPELKATVINTACRVHLKETPESKELNYELIRFLVMLAR